MLLKSLLPIVLLISLSTFSQEVSFRYLTNEDGISQSEVYCFLHDSKGYIWFGSLYGLNKYDRYDIEIFRTDSEDPNSLHHNTISDLVEDNHGRIWIGTHNGLNVYDLKTSKMYAVPNFFAGRNAIINTLFVDGDNLWIGTQKGLFRMTIEGSDINQQILMDYANKTSYVDIEVNGKPSIYASVFKMIKTEDGKIWLATWEGLSCFHFDINKENQYNFLKIPNKIQSIRQITSMVEDGQNNIWLGTLNNGLYQYNHKLDSMTQVSSSLYEEFISDQIKSLAVGMNGDLWIGTLKDGLLRLKNENITQKKYVFDLFQNKSYNPGSINSNLIRSIYVSRDGLVWIGTLGSGINIYNPYKHNFGLRRIPPYDSSGKANNFIRSIYPDKKGNIWLGLHNDGLVRYDINEDRYYKLGLEEFLTVFDIFQVDENHLWIATSSGAHLLKMDETEIEVKASVNFKKKSDLFAYDASFNIEESKPGVYWVASMSGIARVILNNNYQLKVDYYNKDSNPALSIDNVRVLKYDSSKNILWAGTEGGGLNCIYLDEEQTPVEVRVFQHSENDTISLSSNYVRSICLDDKENLWIGTYEGLNRLSFEHINESITISIWKESDGLPNNMIQSIEQDQDNNLWIGTNGGLSKYSPDKNVFFNYYISEGLQSNEFSEHASYFDNKKLYFGGIDGFNVFNPEDIKARPVYGVVRITNFYLANKKVKVGEKVNNHVILESAIDQTKFLKLKSNENDIRFEFSALASVDPNNVRYTYKLEGYDEQWIERDAMDRFAVYTNLPYGRYKFMVKASNSQDDWIVDPAEIDILIKTPIYLRLWALITYMVLLLGGIYFFTRQKIISIAKKEKLILDINHKKRIHDLDMQRTRFFINVSHDLRTPLTLITGPTTEILKELDKNSKFRSKVEIVDRNAKRLLVLVEQILDVRKIEAGKLEPHPKRIDLVDFIHKEASHFEHIIEEKEISLNVICSKESIITQIDPDMMSKALFNLISNAIKYTDFGKIEIKVDCLHSNKLKISWPECPSSECIRVDIKDTGEGMSEEKLGKVFKRYFNDPNNKIKGYGIGLSHCKELILVQKGHISVKSKVGVGTTFSIFVPVFNSERSRAINSGLAIAEPETDKVPVTNDVQISTDEEAINKFKTVLIVDDNDDLRYYLRSSLEHKYNVIEAVDGEDGLKKTELYFPEMIVCDIMMPIMDGIAFCKHIKSNLHTSHIPIILLTARTDSDIKYKGIENGADDYISKPFEIDYLILRIKNILDAREYFKSAFKKSISLEPSTVSVTSTDEDFLKKLMKILEDNISDSEFRVEMLEKEIGLSHTHFYRKIKSLTGQTGKELLQNVRLKRAVQLLEQDKLRVSEIAYKTGFNNPKYFSKCFKEKYGVVPSQYSG